jgi:mycothiol synthase
MEVNAFSGGDTTVNIQARPYRDAADMARMKHLVIVGTQANIAASYMHPGLLDYHTQYPDTRYPPDEQANRRNLRLWEDLDADPPSLQAWAMFSRLEGSVDLFVHPELYGTPLHEAVMDTYVVWAEARAREAGLQQMMPWWAMEYDAVLARLMQARGFVTPPPVGPPAPLFERTLDALPLVQLPDGFTVQGVSNPEEGRLRAWVTHGAFSAHEDWEGYTAGYAQFMGSAVYDGEHDLFVRAPDGRGASACTIWLDPVNAMGLFEPVGTHPEFQRQGLGKAVMAEGLRRMKAAGMRRAIVGFDPNNLAALALYTSMGFQASCYFTFPRKEV